MIERHVEAGVHRTEHEEYQRQEQIRFLIARQLWRPYKKETVSGRADPTYKRQGHDGPTLHTRDRAMMGRPCIQETVPGQATLHARDSARTGRPYIQETGP